MHVTRHTDLDAFLDAVAPMAARGEASASFFTGGAHAMKRTPPRASERVYLATCRGDGTFGAAMLRDEGQVLIGESDPAAGARVRRRPRARLAGTPGRRRRGGRMRCVRAEMERADRARCPAACSHAPAHARRRQRGACGPGTVRMATVADTPWLIERQMAFIAEVGIPDPPARVRERMPSRIARGDFRIWDDGAPVAYAGCNDSAPDFARIAPVYTLPERRGRGYATALVARTRARAARARKAQVVPDDRCRERDLQCDLRPDRLPRRERRLRLRFHRASRLAECRRRDSCARTSLAPELAGRTVELDPAAAHHATRVLRLAIGDALTLFDGTGGEYAATLVRADKRGASVRVERFLPVERESHLR